MQPTKWPTRAFRQSRIAFTDIYRIIDHTLDRMDNIAAPSLDDYMEVNRRARAIAAQAVGSHTAAHCLAD